MAAKHSSVYPSEPVTDAFSQGLTLVHFSAQRKHFSWTRWVLSADMWVITRHKLDTQRLVDQNGLG